MMFTNHSQSDTEEITCSSQATVAKLKSYGKWTKEEEQMLVDLSRLKAKNK